MDSSTLDLTSDLQSSPNLRTFPVLDRHRRPLIFTVNLRSSPVLGSHLRHSIFTDLGSSPVTFDPHLQLFSDLQIFKIESCSKAFTGRLNDEIIQFETKAQTMDTFLKGLGLEKYLITFQAKGV